MPARLGGERSWSDLEETIEYALFWLAQDSVKSGRPAVLEIVASADGASWRLTTSAGRIVATSVETYASMTAAQTAAERVRSAPRHFEFQVMAVPGAFRWNIVAENGRIVAESTESFATKRDAERAARDAHALVAGAAVRTDASVDRAPRHVVVGSDGRWQVRTEGVPQATSSHETQADALRSATRQAAKTQSGAEVIVHGRDGRVRSSKVVKPG